MKWSGWRNSRPSGQKQQAQIDKKIQMRLNRQERTEDIIEHKCRKLIGVSYFFYEQQSVLFAPIFGNSNCVPT